MEQSELLDFLIEVFDRLDLGYLITGSVATSYYGEPRFTNDIDVVVELSGSRIRAFCRAFPAENFYLSQDAVRSAVREQRQFNIIHPATGLKVDVFVLNESAFDRSRFDRRRLEALEEGKSAWLASPEDVVLKKLVYFEEGGSEKHIRDILGVLKVQGPKIDFDYIHVWAGKLNLSETWDTVRQEFEKSDS